MLHAHPSPSLRALARLRLKRIVLPIDFSACAERAMPRALALAERCGAEVHLLHVLLVPETTPHDPSGEPEAEEMLLWRAERARARLETLRMTYRSNLVSRGSASVQVAVEEDVHAASGIVRYTCRHEADLIVMGTHGGGSRPDMPLGSVTERVLGRTPCSVMTVPVHQRAAGVVRRVLVPLEATAYPGGDAAARGYETLCLADWLAAVSNSTLLLTGQNVPDETAGQGDGAAGAAEPEWPHMLRHLNFRAPAVVYDRAGEAASLHALQSTDVLVVPSGPGASLAARTGSCSVLAVGSAEGPAFELRPACAMPAVRLSGST